MGSLEVDEGMIACVPGVLEPPMPFFGGIEGFAGDLPIEKIHFFLLTSLALNTQILMLFANTLHFPQGEIKVVGMQIVQCRDGND